MKYWMGRDTHYPCSKVGNNDTEEGCCVVKYRGRGKGERATDTEYIMDHCLVVGSEY